jgi:hypothetical protein
MGWKSTSPSRSRVGSRSSSRCKVNDGAEVNVAVEVEGWVKVIVEDKVNSRAALPPSLFTLRGSR